MKLIGCFAALSLLIHPTLGVSKKKKPAPMAISEYQQILNSIDLKNSVEVCIGALPFEEEDALGVSFIDNTGRLGDVIQNYIHARWIAYKYDIPFYVPYISHLQPFALVNKYPTYTDQVFPDVKQLYLGYARKPEALESVFYQVEYFPDAKFYHLHKIKLGQRWPYFSVDYSDDNFFDILVDDFSTEDQIDLVYPPEEKLSVALHYRAQDGGDYNTRLYLSFAPDSYYISQIERLYRRFPNEMIYIHLFTNHRNPHELLSFFKQKFSEYERIEFGMREDSKATSTILDDFFSFRNFDCFIHPTSNFSMMAGRLHRFKYEVYPEKYELTGKAPLITHFHMIDRDQNIDKIMHYLEVL